MNDLPPRAPRSVLRLLKLLELLAHSQEGLTLAAISVALDSPKSSLLALLRPMVTEDYLVHRNGRYMSGAKTFRLAAAIFEGHQFPRAARQYLVELAESTDESVFLAAIDREAETATYVDIVEGRQAVRYTVPAGTVRPLYSSAAGLCLLAFQKMEWREAYCQNVDIQPLTEYTVQSQAALRVRCNSIREKGVAVSVRESVSDAAGIAAPVFASDGRVDYAVLVGQPAERFRKNDAKMEQLVKTAANKISFCFGGHGFDGTVINKPPEIVVV